MGRRTKEGSRPRNHRGLLVANVVLLLVLGGLVVVATQVEEGGGGGADPAGAQEPSDTPAEPTKILLVGDSIAAEVGSALTAAYTAPGTVASFSLLPAVSSPSIATDMALILEEQQPDIVLVMVGSWEAAGVDQDVPGWEQTYVDTVLQPFVEQVHAADAEVVWIGYPRLGDAEQADRHELLNGVWASLGERLGDPSVGYVDAGAAVEEPDGSYTDSLVVNGVEARVRADDGKHLCPAGAVLMGGAVVDALSLGYGLPPDEGWETDPWTTDPAAFTEPGLCASEFPAGSIPSTTTTLVDVFSQPAG
jgi:hypothetical protein